MHELLYNYRFHRCLHDEKRGKNIPSQKDDAIEAIEPKKQHDILGGRKVRGCRETIHTTAFYPSQGIYFQSKITLGIY